MVRDGGRADLLMLIEGAARDAASGGDLLQDGEAARVRDRSGDVFDLALCKTGHGFKDSENTRRLDAAGSDRLRQVALFLVFVEYRSRCN